MDFLAFSSLYGTEIINNFPLKLAVFCRSVALSNIILLNGINHCRCHCQKGGKYFSCNMAESSSNNSNKLFMFQHNKLKYYFIQLMLSY